MKALKRLLALVFLLIAGSAVRADQAAEFPASPHADNPAVMATALCDSNQQILPSQCEALVALYNSTDGANWTHHDSWLQTDRPCDWYGVQCTSLGYLRGLYLASNNLSGPLPPEIGDLTTLSVLNLSNNQLTGNLPTSIGNLTALYQLYLNNNLLSGSIPSTLGNLTNLTTLYLYSNTFTSAIPAQIGNLVNLTSLILTNNQLNGSIPSTFGSLSHLTYLDLSLNNLTGAIPATLGNLGNLNLLALMGNELTGSIPSQLGSLVNLEWLFLSNNQLNGSIPSTIGNLTNLKLLDMGSNQLSGAIPPEIGNMTSLRLLQLNNNRLTGAIPPELGNAQNLESLLLQNNALVGAIPTPLASLLKVDTINNFSSEDELDLSYNALYFTDFSVRDFFNVKDPDWKDTQTIAPTNIETASAVVGTVNLSWTPIFYTDDGGFYEISYAVAPDGSYTVAGTTSDKSVSSFSVTNLTRGRVYNFRIRTYTPAHGSQQNNVWSDYSAPVVALISAAPQRNYYTTSTPTLAWNRLTWATEYEIQVDSSSNFTLPLSFSITVPLTTLETATTPLANGQYYWRVRGRRSNGTWGSWNTVQNFVVDAPG